MLGIDCVLNVTRDKIKTCGFMIIYFRRFDLLLYFYFKFFFLCNSVGFTNIFRVLVIEQRTKFVVISQKQVPLELCNGSINKGILRLIKYGG